MIDWRNYFPAFLCALMLAGCASNPQLPTVASACLQTFEKLDRQLADAGLHDAAAYRIPAYPFLRLSRFMSSFAGELDSPEKKRAWLGALRTEDQRARVLELQNLGFKQAVSADVLEDCGRHLVQQLLQDEDGFNRLLLRAGVPDDYSMLARLLGIYPLSRLFLRKGVEDYQAGVLQDYARELDTPASVHLQVLRPPEQSIAVSVDVASSRNVLGIPELSSANWQALALEHAPVWQLEVAGVDDLPGAVRLQPTPSIDAAQVVTYLHTGYTRLSGQVLPQLVYMLWFPRRTADGPLDPYAGEFDAVLWRVTLGLDGQPMAYDSIHGCGCYHYFFTANTSSRTGRENRWQEPVLMPQTELPDGRLVLRLQAGTHYLRRVLSDTDGRQEQKNIRHYVLARYDRLRSLPVGADGNASLFASDGLVPGSERLERFWLWPSGVKSPGAMRQIGRHATAFVGRRHFDDPYLFEAIFTE